MIWHSHGESELIIGSSWETGRESLFNTFSLVLGLFLVSHVLPRMTSTLQVGRNVKRRCLLKSLTTTSTSCVTWFWYSEDVPSAKVTLYVPFPDSVGILYLRTNSVETKPCVEPLSSSMWAWQPLILPFSLRSLCSLAPEAVDVSGPPAKWTSDGSSLNCGFSSDNNGSSKNNPCNLLDINTGVVVGAADVPSGRTPFFSGRQRLGEALDSWPLRVLVVYRRNIVSRACTLHVPHPSVFSNEFQKNEMQTVQEGEPRENGFCNCYPWGPGPLVPSTCPALVAQCGLQLQHVTGSWGVLAAPGAWVPAVNPSRITVCVNAHPDQVSAGWVWWTPWHSRSGSWSVW